MVGKEQAATGGQSSTNQKLSISVKSRARKNLDRHHLELQ